MSSSDPLRLTAADIAAAEASSKAGPVLTAVLTITPDDLTAVSPQPTTTPTLAAHEQLIFRLTNDARRQILPRWWLHKHLRWHSAAAAVARGHAADMLQRHYIDHTSLEGDTITDRLRRSGIRYLACGENIGVVYGDASHSEAGIHDMHQAFLRQPNTPTSHRGNLLNPMWTHAGMGLAYHESGTLILTQIFLCTT